MRWLWSLGVAPYAMEAVARRIAVDKRVMVLRNGWFPFRWSQIFEAGGIPGSETVIKAQFTGNDAQAVFAPAPIEEVVAKITADHPDMVFAPHNAMKVWPTAVSVWDHLVWTNSMMWMPAWPDQKTPWIKFWLLNAFPAQDASKHGGVAQSGGLCPIPKPARVRPPAPQP